MRKMIIWASLIVLMCNIIVPSVLKKIIPNKIVDRNTPNGWSKIIDDDGDGIADATLIPMGRGHSRVKPTVEDQEYFKNHQK
jgi:hypothetical protein